MNRGRPIHFIEAKCSDSEVTKGLKYLKSIYPEVRSSLVHLNGKKDFISAEGIEYIPVPKRP